jgi:hypothetical protein
VGLQNSRSRIVTCPGLKIYTSVAQLVERWSPKLGLVGVRVPSLVLIKTEKIGSNDI